MGDAGVLTVGKPRLLGARDWTRARLAIDFHPANPKGPFTVTKQVGGAKRRYLQGVTSGPSIDGHGERMTERCIESFRNQANSGDILLFAGKHDVDYTDDIGRLAQFDILENGDWYTAYVLHELGAGAVGPVKMETVETVWAQSNGLPPYKVPFGFGFSIEGDIPDGGILFMDEQGRRVIDDVKLAGVVLVRNPAYRTSVAHAVMKALGLPTTQEIRKALSGGLLEAAERKEEERDYWDAKFQLADALEEMVSTIMQSPDPDKQDQLRDVFAQYSDLMVGLITEHPSAFQETGQDDGDAAPSRVYEAETNQRQDLHAWIVSAKAQLDKICARLRQEGASNAEEQSDGPHGDVQ